MTEYHAYLISPISSILEAMQKIDGNRKGFLIVVDEGRVVGTLTDGDIRRALIHGKTLDGSVSDVFVHDFKCVRVTDSFDDVIELFKDSKVKFLPIVDDTMQLCNIITKTNLHSLLLQDLSYNPYYSFESLDDELQEHEIYPRPWGYYKTTFLNQYCQCKILRVNPKGVLSLQMHHKRDEQWCVVHGLGEVQIGDGIFSAAPGDAFEIPRGALHRLRNLSDTESLIVTEVQMGEYFGEDDIVRVEDVYGRDIPRD